MTHISRSFLYAIAALSVTPVIFLLTGLGVYRSLGRSEAAAFLVGDLFTAIVFAVLWVCAWRRSINWTPPRALLTALCWFISIVPAFGAFLATVAMRSSNDEIGIILAGITWLASWIVLTAFVWCESKKERLARLNRLSSPKIECVGCHYDMRGLHEARCPECGTQYTLDGLLSTALEGMSA